MINHRNLVIGRHYYTIGVSQHNNYIPIILTLVFVGSGKDKEGNHCYYFVEPHKFLEQIDYGSCDGLLSSVPTGIPRFRYTRDELEGLKNYHEIVKDLILIKHNKWFVITEDEQEELQREYGDIVNKRRDDKKT